ncbi:MAG: hypothetical protein KH111_15215, partial [Bacteroidales bacterium]|nr:hypothetical protein [Bacteroidales bacterium]
FLLSCTSLCNYCKEVMRIIQYIGVILFFFLVSCEKDNVEPQKTRTLMVYLAGDNNLSGHMQKNISSMMSAWKKSYNANIVIYFDAPNAAPELYTFRFKGKEVEKQVLKTYEEMDSADPEVLKKILNEMQDLYPSDSYGLILGSHASGWIPSGGFGRSNRMLYAEPVLTRSFGTDYTGPSQMDTRDMAKAIPFNKENLEFILFDACLMSSIEVLYDLRDKAKYVIASPAELPAPGFPYNRVMPYFWGKGKNLEEDLVKVCDEFWDYYNTYNATNRFGTIALIKMDGMEHLFDLTREILQGKKDYVADIYQKAVYCYPMVEYSKYDRFFDLGEYMKYMTEGREGLYKEYRDFLDNQVVIYKNVTNPFYYISIPEEKFSGIATYIPLSIWPTETNAYWGFSWSGVYDAVTE